MQSKLIDIYMNKPVVNVDFNLTYDVNCDNIHSKLNEIYNNDWVCEITEIQNSILVTLYVPGRILTGVANINKEICIGETVACAMAIAFNNAYKTSKSPKATVPVTNSNVISINDIPDETSIPVADVKENIPTRNNSFGIRDEQIKFMSDFKTKNNIDTNEKFDHYVRVWSENTGNEITTKSELIKSGEKKVDEFIKWIVYIEQSNIIIGKQ